MCIALLDIWLFKKDPLLEERLGLSFSEQCVQWELGILPFYQSLVSKELIRFLVVDSPLLNNRVLSRSVIRGN
jgi:hypothetical protein